MCPLPDDRSASLTSPFGSSQLSEFSSDERSVLLQLAHEAIAATLDERELLLAPPSPHLAELRGAFTTLYYRGSLRGCVGYALPVKPLYRTIRRNLSGRGLRRLPLRAGHSRAGPRAASLPQRSFSASIPFRPPKLRLDATAC